MEAITATFVPRMIQELSDYLCQSWQQEEINVSSSTPSPRIHGNCFTGNGPSQNITTSWQREAITVARDFAIKAIALHADQLLADVRVSEIAFKQQQNSLCPINRRFPGEVLGLIFAFAADHPSVKPRTAVRISHVSTLWRQIALSTPRLWQKVDGPINENLARAYVLRSGTVPLSIELGDPTTVDLSIPSQQDLLALFRASMHHSHRWRSLVLYCPNTGSQVLEGQCRGLQAPQLRTFRACFGSPLPLRSSFIFSTGIFENHTPSLRDLHLDGVSIPLTCTIYAGLTSLVLANTFHPGARPRDLLQIIVACPLLETLGIYHTEFNRPLGHLGSSADFRPASVPLPVPHLQTLTLVHVRDVWVQYMLSSIRCPPSVRIHVVCMMSDLYKVLPPAESIGEHLPGISATRSVEIVFSPSKTSMDIYCFATDDGETFRFTAKLPNYGSDISDAVLGIGHLSHLPHLESLSIKGGEGLDAERLIPGASLEGALEQFSSITSLSLTDCPMHLAELFTITKTSHLLPFLDSITLAGGEISGRSLAALVKSRTRLGPRGSPVHQHGVYLREIRIRNFEKIETKTRAALERLPLNVDIKLDKGGSGCLTWIRSYKDIE
ncbi:hypothetical protein BOTBODRAFT_187801 [Botryobasidium botryosum FD-172 SS1]|uniref:Uncharacterized protein n=1 Tax=Botryobasidium botryosum (strain FD-172 SS1) TaxID=930990 RepID=A0A067MG05_BOTB1|nr:hypothetical protein BOTBODRAFT_187801 [Botryobasidium botryosum FD-172 SS1]